MRFIQSLVLPALVIAAAAGFYLASKAMRPHSNCCEIEGSWRVRYMTGPTLKQAIISLGGSPDDIELAEPHEHSR
jgi:hypothetical protein